MNKRNLCARLAWRLGIVGMVEAFARRDCLLVLNYHRLGDRHQAQFDEGVYSATGEEFERQVAHLRRKYSVVTLEEAVHLVTGSHRFGGTAILLTFDDGYLDNYRIAFPILRSLQVQGTFFLVSSYLENPVIPWWDRIAYMVRHSKNKTLRLTYPEALEFPLLPGRRADVIFRVLPLYTSPKTGDPQRLLEELQAACSPYDPLPKDVRLFLNLSEAREMVQGGMAIGSHTRSHQRLSALSREEQMSELAESRASLSRELGIAVDTLAYPYGGRASFNETTRSVLGDAGYRAAFSFYGGVNRPGTTDCLDVRRFAVDGGQPFARFRLRTAGASAANGYWF